MKNKYWLETVSPNLDLPKQEEAVLRFWQKEKIFEQSVESRPQNNPFVFFEGPPTANGKPGIHHVLARAFKDLIPRYKTMRGFRVERKAGWDTHGLPVELQVEKSLGISSKIEIENIVPGDKAASIAKFNALCKESVWQYKEEWEKLTQRMGFWVDLNHPYITYETDYIETVWWILKQIWDRGLLYEDYKVTPYCYRCGTTLSSHEVALGYNQTTDRSIYVKFKVKDRPNLYLIAWTTTPWTLPGNVALAVNPEIEYRIFEDYDNDQSYILADARAKVIFGNRELKSRPITIGELQSLKYEPLFSIKALTSDTAYQLYPANFVTTEDGSGIVHTAVMYGEDDFALGVEVGLPKHHTVDEQGKFTSDVTEFADLKVKDPKTELAIINNLKDRGLLLREESYRHTYPFCWRCDNPLIYYAKHSWFIKMSALRDELIKRNQTINWVPEHLKQGRFGQWLEEVKDWALSRDRYWGTPLPIWRCQSCKNQLCIGSIDELKALSNQRIEKDFDPHKPYIDGIRLKCPKCDQSMERYSEVIDVWFDSGAMPLAQWHFPFSQIKNQKSKIKKNDLESLIEKIPYPADYIAEAIDQTRGWFYTLLAIATLLDLEAPYRSVVSMSHVLDKHGKKMSKSRGNVVDPMEVISNIGVDPLRFYFYCVNQPSDSKKFDVADVETVKRKLFLITWNVYSFLASAASTISWRMKQLEEVKIGNTHPLDQWLVAKTNQLIKGATDHYEKLEIFHAARMIAEYINDLSTWYLRLSRKRTDQNFLPTLYWALRQLTLLLAPMTPFFAEILWQKIRFSNDQISVHLANWPQESDFDQEILDQMSKIQKLVELARAERASVKIKGRQPLAKATIGGLEPTSLELSEIIKAEINVKSLEFKKADSLKVELDTRLTDELKIEGQIRELSRIIAELRKKAQLTPGQKAKIFLWGEQASIARLKEHMQLMSEITSCEILYQEHQTNHWAQFKDLKISLES